MDAASLRVSVASVLGHAVHGSEVTLVRVARPGVGRRALRSNAHWEVDTAQRAVVLPQGRGYPPVAASGTRAGPGPGLSVLQLGF